MASLADKALGTLIRIQESGVDALYEIGGFNAHGANTATLVRKRSYGESLFNPQQYQFLYDGSILDNLCNTTIYERYPEKLRRYIVPVGIITLTSTSTSITIIRRCFSLSYTELGFGPNGTILENSPLTLYTTNESRQRLNAAGSQAAWWTRSYGGGQFVRFIQNFGTTNSVYPNQTNVQVVPAFVLPSSRPLWDEPNPDGSYNLSYAEYIDIDVPLGSLTDMPKAIRTMLQYQGQITALYACNNYNDSSPAWEAVLDNAEHTFANATKTASQWAVAVRVTIERAASEEVYLNEFPAIVRC